MIEQKKNNLRDYLYQAIQEMGLNEKEMKIICEYTDSIIDSFAPLINITETNENKDLLVKSLSKIIEDMNVKRNS